MRDEGKKEKYIRQLLDFIARCKHPSFSEEQEWRILKNAESKTNDICVSPQPNGLRPYVKFSLDRKDTGGRNDLCIKSIRIGPHPHQDLQANAVKKLARQHGIYLHEDPKISEIPFRQV
jgi:hypothetical protein